MNCIKSSLVFLAVVLALTSTTEGFDITKILNQYPEFALFNKYLTETKLVDQINSRSTVTVLVLDDNTMATVAGNTSDVIKVIMSTQVLVNYYDEKKWVEVGATHEPMENLFQSSGAAMDNHGYIYVAVVEEGEIAFRSASTANNAAYDVYLVKTVVKEPDVYSIFEVSKPIESAPPTLNGSTTLDASMRSNAADSPGASALAPAPAPSSSCRLSVTFIAALSLFMLAF
ncbi:Fasciclin-like arabinogalactan protein 14, partial [Mucuna pruriens]